MDPQGCNKHSDSCTDALKKDAFSSIRGYCSRASHRMGECGSLTVDPGCLDKSPQLQSSELKLLMNRCQKFKLRPGQNSCVQKKLSINKSVQVCPRRCAHSSDKGRQKPYLDDVLFFDFQRKGGLEAAQLPPAGPNLPLRVLRTVRLLMCSQNTDSSSTSCFNPHMVRACSITFVSV